MALEELPVMIAPSEGDYEADGSISVYPLWPEEVLPQPLAFIKHSSRRPISRRRPVQAGRVLTAESKKTDPGKLPKLNPARLDEQPQLILCSMRVTCEGKPASRKCFSCAELQPKTKGFCCEDCFIKCHPWHRQPHRWVDVDETEEWRESGLGKSKREQVETRVEAVQKVQALTAEVREVMEKGDMRILKSRGSVRLRILTSSNSRAKSLEKELKQNTEAVRQALAKMYKAEESLRIMKGLTGVSQDLPPPLPEGTSTPNEAREPPARATTAQTDASLSSISNSSKRPPLRPGTSNISLFRYPLGASDYNRAAVMIQCLYRKKTAYRERLRLLLQTYQCVPANGERGTPEYFYSIRTGKSQWARPRGIAHLRYFNPQRQARYLFLVKNPELAVRKIVSALEGNLAKTKFRRLLCSSFQKLKDPRTGLFYYYNAKTKESTWEKPKVFRNLDIEDFQLQENLKAKKSRKSQMVELNTDTAAAKIQSLCRMRKAQTDARQLVRQTYDKVFDKESARYYYYHKRTREAQWKKPILLGNEDLAED